MVVNKCCLLGSHSYRLGAHENKGVMFGWYCISWYRITLLWRRSYSQNFIKITLTIKDLADNIFKIWCDRTNMTDYLSCISFLKSNSWESLFNPTEIREIIGHTSLALFFQCPVTGRFLKNFILKKLRKQFYFNNQI